MLPMNAYDRKIANEPGLAQLHYGDGEYAVLKPGRFVLCAVTGAKIPLEDLRYWNPVTQEAFAGPEQALKRWRELNPAEKPA
jgi:hypothetical protein